MKRTAFRLLLAQCILLLGFCSQSFALPHQNEFSNSVVEKSGTGTQNFFSTPQDARTHISKSSRPGSGETNNDLETSIFEKEEEEDKSVSFNTLVRNASPSEISYALVLHHHQQSINKRLHVAEHSLFPSVADHNSLLQKFQI